MRPVDRINAMAEEMGKPCARGMIHPSHALAAITRSVVRIDTERPPDLPIHFTVAGTIHTAHGILKRAAKAHVDRMNATRRAIQKDAMARLEQRQPANAIRAEAHNINGEAGFPLMEHQVEEQVRAAAEIIMKRRAEAPHAQ